MRIVPTVVPAGLLLAGSLLIAGVTAPASADSTVAPPEVPPEPARTVFTDNPGIVSPGRAAVESWTRTADGLAVNFMVGTPTCYGAHAHVVETPETVTVEVWTGTLPEAVNRPCIKIAVLGTLEVPLAEPVGDRQVRAVA